MRYAFTIAFSLFCPMVLSMFESEMDSSSYLLELEQLEAEDYFNEAKIEARKCFCYAFPCQKKVAHIYNMTIEAINKCDFPMLCYRYLQAKAGQKHICYETLGWVGLGIICSAILTWSAYLEGGLNLSHFILFSPAFFIVIACLIINIDNRDRYKKIVEMAKEIFADELNECGALFEKVVNLSYEKLSLKELVEICEMFNLDCQNLIAKIAKKIN